MRKIRTRLGLGVIVLSCVIIRHAAAQDVTDPHIIVPRTDTAPPDSWAPPSGFSFYPHSLPPYSYPRHEGRTYDDLTPDGPRFSTRLGPHGYAYW
ncbi:MAG: hypothetical protein KDA60_14740 [Planctomycetales bacterium]|nr:hypothetical protein [Planctomycetales bacterium]